MTTCGAASNSVWKVSKNLLLVSGLDGWKQLEREVQSLAALSPLCVAEQTKLNKNNKLEVGQESVSEVWNQADHFWHV